MYGENAIYIYKRVVDYVKVSFTYECVNEIVRTKVSAMASTNPCSTIALQS